MIAEEPQILCGNNSVVLDPANIVKSFIHSKDAFILHKLLQASTIYIYIYIYIYAYIEMLSIDLAQGQGRNFLEA